MDEIIRQELWRSAGIFFLAFMFSVFVVTKSYKASFFTMLGLPLIITLMIFLILVLVRKKLAKNKKPKKQKQLTTKKLFIPFIIFMIIFILLRLLVLEKEITAKFIIGMIVGLILFYLYFRIAIPIYYKNVNYPLFRTFAIFGLAFLLMGLIMPVSFLLDPLHASTSTFKYTSFILIIIIIIFFLLAYIFRNK